VGLLMATLILLAARLMSSARDSYRLNEEAYFRGSIACFLMTCIWFLDACLVSGYFDLTCSSVPACNQVSGWNEGGWNVTGAWCSVAVWFFAFLVYMQLSRHPPEENARKKLQEEEAQQEDATWTVSQAEIVKGPSANFGQPSTETITLKCNDPNPFTIVIHGVTEDGSYVPLSDRVTIDGERINPRRYPAIINALRRAIVPPQEDVLAVDRALLIMENASEEGPVLASAGLPSAAQAERDRAEMDRMRLQQGRDERKLSTSTDGGRLAQELLEQKRANQALQKELDERKLAERKEAEHATGRQRAQSEQEKEASQLLQQMVELEALQQKQHADQIAALEKQITQLKRAGAGQGGPGSGGKQGWDGDETLH